jgi:predicted membrane protein
MSEISSYIKIEKPSEKSFGALFSIIFLIISLYPLIQNKELHLWALMLSALFLLLAFVSPKLLVLPNKLWFKFGLLLGAIIAPILMAIVYCIIVVPTGIIMRVLGKDLLKQKLDDNAKSYWIERSDPVGTMKNQY